MRACSGGLTPPRGYGEASLEFAAEPGSDGQEDDANGP